MKSKQLLKNSIIAASILSLLAIYSTNFNSKATYLLVIGGFIISIIDYVLSIGIGMHKSIYSRLLISIISSITIIYILQLISEGFIFPINITLISSIAYAILSNTFLIPKEEQAA